MRVKIGKEIPHPGHSTTKSLQEYSPEQKAHPARNRPEAVAWLIEYYLPGDPGVVYDPMAGALTVLQEAEKRGHGATGWDISPKCQKLLRERVQLQNVGDLRDDSVDFILFSPPFGLRSNHRRGDSDAQRRNAASIGSTAGTEYEEDEVPGHLGQEKRWDVYLTDLEELLWELWPKLRIGGVIGIIVKNQIEKGRELPWVALTEMLMRATGYEMETRHRRRLEPSATWRQRAQLARERGQPEPPHVGSEWTLIGRKVYFAASRSEG